MVRIWVWLAAFLFRLLPFFTRLLVYVTAIWHVIQKVLNRPAAWAVVTFYPILEFMVELFTGHRGPLSNFIQGFLNKVFDVILHVGFNTNIQALVSQIPANVSHYCCYLGLNAALQLLFDGFVNAMTILLTLELTILGFFIKMKITMSRLTFRKM